MSLLLSPRQSIRLLLPDIVLGGTRIKQIGYVIGQSWQQPRFTGEVNGVITVQVVRHAVDASQPDELGNELPPEFNRNPLVYLRGANDTLLAADTGEQLALQGALSEADWLVLVQAKADELHPRPVILQGDGLELLMHQQVVTADEIRRHLAAAPVHHWAPKDAQGQPILSA